MFDAILDSSKFKKEPIPMAALDVVGWWESRRFFYNAVVGCTGLVSCVLVAICVVISEATIGESIGLPDGPLLGVFAIVVYGILANVFYTAGWISELIMRSISTSDKSVAYASKAFRFCVQFSILLTILPAAICWISFAMALISGNKLQAAPE